MLAFPVLLAVLGLVTAFWLSRQSRRRSAVVVAFLAADFWQFLFAALSSLQLSAPGVGNRALWVPNVLVGETFTILPLGFILCLWGAPLGRAVAALCAASSIVLALVATVTLAAAPLDVPQSLFYFALLAAPGLVLIVCVSRMRGAPSRGV
jgi:hypothetical protein